MESCQQTKKAGRSPIHKETKERVNMSLTPTARDGLDFLATSLEISRSELIERIGRGLIPLAVPQFYQFPVSGAKAS